MGREDTKPQRGPHFAISRKMGTQKQESTAEGAEDMERIQLKTQNSRLLCVPVGFGIYVAEKDFQIFDVDYTVGVDIAEQIAFG